MNFSPGDQAVVIDGVDKPCRQYLGELVTVISPLMPGHSPFSGVEAMFHLVDISNVYQTPFGLASDVAYRPQDLRPFIDPSEVTHDSKEKITEGA